MRYILTIIAAILLAGCSVTTPPIYEYRIAPKVTTKTFESNSCSDKSLKVSQVFSATTLMSTKMRYVQDEYMELVFNESKWSTNPNSAINAELVKSIQMSEIFSSVESFKSRSRADLILETNVEEFVQYFSDENKKSFVQVVISFSLVDSKSSNVLKSIRVKKNLEVDTLDAKGGVKALNSALSDVLEQNNRWLSGVCK